MTEKKSKSLGINYVVVKGCFITETGVKLERQDVENRSTEEIRNIYEAKLKGPLFDYAHAKSQGIIRKHKNKNGNCPAKSNAQAFREYVEKKRALEKPVRQKRKLDFQVTIIRITMALVGIAAVQLSAIYTYRFLLPSNGLFIAMTLSCSMIVFSVVDFDVIIYFWSKSKKVLAGLFSILWIIVASFSIFSTMAVNYDGYIALEEASYEDNVQTNTNRLRIDNLDARLKAKQEEAATVAATIKDYTESVEQVSAWYLQNMQKNLSEINKEIQELFASKDLLIEETPDSLITEETKKVSFYDSVERILGIPARLLHFVVHMLPAVFIDIIAPFSIAIAIFLGGNKDEDSNT